MAEKGFKLDFAFIPFPEDVVDAQPPLLQCEWQLLGYLLLQIRFGEALQPLLDDELLNGILQTIEGKVSRIDHGCGLSRNGLKKAREALVARGWLLMANMSNDRSRPCWTYRLLLRRRQVTPRQQVSQRDSVTDGQLVSRQVNAASRFDSALSQHDSAVSQLDTCNKEDRKDFKKNHIEKPKAENSAAPVEKSEEQRRKQANLDTWDLRRYQQELEQLSGANPGGYGDAMQCHRTAAYRAGIPPERHVELLKKFFPNSEWINEIYEHLPLFVQPKPPETEEEIAEIAERSFKSAGGGA